jgi:hypothetical protein
MHIKVVPLALALAVGVGASILPQASWSQTIAPSQGQPQARPQPGPSRIEGRIAFLRAELKPTTAQAPLFEAVATAMRENDRAMRANFVDRPQPGTAMTLPERLERRQKRAEAMASAAGKLRAAWAPLYASLSDEQKKTADELAAERGRRMGHRTGQRGI